MADQEQLARLKQSVRGWNKWREEHPEINIDLTEADFRKNNLIGVNLGGVGFQIEGYSHYYGMEMDGRRVKVNGANFDEANLWGANFALADLSGAHFGSSDLGGSNLVGAKFCSAKFFGADFRIANLTHAWLEETDFRRSRFEGSILGDNDLSGAMGLDEVWHGGPSPIGTSTLERSKGKIPEKFLRGCGLSDWEIESAKLYQPGLSAQEDNMHSLN
jgi:uncharacterized protein YjbI with pentapeptide repeats